MFENDTGCTCFVPNGVHQLSIDLLIVWMPALLASDLRINLINYLLLYSILRHLCKEIDTSKGTKQQKTISCKICVIFCIESTFRQFFVCSANLSGLTHICLNNTCLLVTEFGHYRAKWNLIFLWSGQCCNFITKVPDSSPLMLLYWFDISYNFVVFP